jgi:hypothetical protein
MKSFITGDVRISFIAVPQVATELNSADLWFAGESSGIITGLIPDFMQ